MIHEIFLNADECILAAATYANKTNEKCVSTPNFTIDNLGFTIEFPSYLLQYKRSIVDIAFNRVTPKPITEMILSNYESIDDFVNNHSKLAPFL